MTDFLKRWQLSVALFAAILIVTLLTGNVSYLSGWLIGTLIFSLVSAFISRRRRVKSNG